MDCSDAKEAVSLGRSFTYRLHFYSKDMETWNEFYGTFSYAAASKNKWRPPWTYDSPPDIGQVDCEPDDGQQEVDLPGPRFPLLLSIDYLLRGASFDHFRSRCHCQVDTFTFTSPPL